MKWMKVFRYILLFTIIAWAVLRLQPQLKDFSELWKLKNQIHYIWVFFAVFAQLFQYIGDAWLSQVLLKIVEVKMKIKDTFRIAALNVFAAHLLPIGEAGGLAAAYHFYKKLGVTTEKFIFLTVCWCIVTYLLLFILLLAPLPFLQYISIKIDVHLIFIVCALTVIGFTIYMTRKTILTKLEKLIGKYEWFKHGKSFFQNRKTYQKIVLQNPGMIATAFLGGLIYYASNIATLALSFMAFGVLPSLPLVCFAYSASLLLGRITLAPAGLGVAEASLILIFLEGKIDSNITIAAVLIYRLISFWLPIPAGFFSFYSLKKSPRKEVMSEMKDL